MIKRLADGFFKWYCDPDYYHDIQGDLEELYQRDQQSFSEWRHLIAVLLLFRPSIIRSFFENSIFKDNGMFRNYLKISIRTLVKHRFYTFVNVFGLAIGLAAFLLINEYVQFERSYDQHYVDADQLYRLTTDQVADGVLGVRDAMSFAPSGKVLTDDLPEITAFTTTYDYRRIAFKQGDNVIEESNVVGADEHFLDLFTYAVLYEDGSDLLIEPNTLVLTRSKALQYFGKENAVGETIFVHSGLERPFKVVAVIEDTPQNTHYKFDILVSLATLKERIDQDGWNGYNYYTFVQLVRGANYEEVNDKIFPLADKYLSDEANLVFTLQPLNEIHLSSDRTYEPELNGNARAISVLSIISIFILIIAWVNYINLSTAKAIDRAKEVGLRKVIGAHKRQVLMQFFIEAAIINLLGAVIAWIIAEISLSYFQALVDKSMLAHTWESSRFLYSLLIFFVAGAFISGFYPALVLSSFKPVEVLKGKFRNSGRGVILRKGLVVVQFGASLVLLAATFIVYQQVDHMRTRDIGMDIDQVIGFANPRVSEEQREQYTSKKQAFFDELTSNNAIVETAEMSNLPGGGPSDINSNAGVVSIIGLTDPMNSTTYIQGVDHKAMELLEVNFIHGRNFIEDMASDTAALIANEAFIERFNLQVSEDLIGQTVRFGVGPDPWEIKIIGIIEDVSRGSSKNKIEPTVYYSWENPGQTIVKISSQNTREALAHVESSWSNFFPTAPLKYTFLDDRFARLYAEDQRFGDVFASFATFAMFVALLGLFGLASFIAVQRQKEVGVRKVLGASIPQILLIFFKDFFVLLGISALIGIPTVYLGMNQWLDNYAFRISFPWLAVVFSAVIVMLFAFGTVGIQIYRVAVLNPAKTLKYE
ncbi:MAG: FtsX-like permease family protein [Cyclobacteriaceae bacterium]